MDLTVQNQEPKQTLNDHLRELRTRLFACILTLVVTGTIIYFFYEPILKILSSSLGSKLYYNTPSGGFSFIMNICFTGALIITIPVIIFNIIMFVRPAFGEIITAKRVASLTLSSTLLAIAGTIFAFFCILPQTIAFFDGFQINGLSALIGVDNYLSFVNSLILVFAVVFQIPLLILFADTINPISIKSLLKMEKWVVIISIVVAIIAPFNYDLLSTVFVSLPIIVLYNLSILIVSMRHKSKEHKDDKKMYSSIINKTTKVSSPELEVDSSTIDNFRHELAILKKANPKIKSSQAMDVKIKSNRQTNRIVK